MTDKGVSWNVGKVFLHDELIYTFNLLPESGHAKPAFINLQQYYVEGYLAERAAQLPNLQMRWKNRVLGLQQQDDHVSITIDTPDGEYTLQAQYVVAADGSRSAIRKLMGLDTQGRVFKDRFLIADVKMKAEFPTERWFWFDPPFHPNQSVLLHRQPDNVWRIDFQLGWDADPVLEKQPERVLPRVRALLGEDAEFELEWVSVYTFACQRMTKFRQGRVLFAGDSAHGVSPFGARGANSGVQDADNLAWKLRWVLQSLAPDALLDSYADERRICRRREHPELVARHRLHHAQERHQPQLPQCRFEACQGLSSLRDVSSIVWPALDTDRAQRFATEYAGQRPLRWGYGAGRGLRRCVDQATRKRWLVAAAPGWSVHRAGLCRRRAIRRSRVDWEIARTEQRGRTVSSIAGARRRAIGGGRFERHQCGRRSRRDGGTAIRFESG